METKYLDAQGKGELDYDSGNDILFFKVRDRKYDRSIELEDVVLDIDVEGYVTGIQIFGASKMFTISKGSLQNIQKWEFKIRTEGKIIFLQLIFEMVRRNQIVERGQNLIREASSLLTDAEVRCAAA